MMMPANFSAVAENEMTYVVGGSLVDGLAPATVSYTHRKPAGKQRTNTFRVMCAINYGWHNLLQKAARSSRSMWTH